MVLAVGVLTVGATKLRDDFPVEQISVAWSVPSYASIGRADRRGRSQPYTMVSQD